MMNCFAGIDLGSSGIKIALVNEEGICIAVSSRHSPIDVPRPGWSQQEPEQWWNLTQDIFDEFAAEHPEKMSCLSGISLSGQMLGQVLLDRNNHPTTPCILWNDQRSLIECDELLTYVPDIGWRANGQPDPGFTAPKLMWLAKNDPEALENATVLMLPKDFVRLKLTGEIASEITDGSSTMLVDCRSKTWDHELITAAGWTLNKLPRLLHPYDPAGNLKPELCKRWSTPPTVIVAAGCGDNYAGALGIGVSRKGQAALSIGTSGVLGAVDDVFRPLPEHGIFTTTHAAPGTYLSMAVIMSATQSLDWFGQLTQLSVVDLVNNAEQRVRNSGIAGRPIARPSITGIRTPDNRPDASAFWGEIVAAHDSADLAYAILEGVAFQFFDSYRVLCRAGVSISDIKAIGGGTRSLFWVSLMATLFDTDVHIPERGEISACLGAARLAQAAVYPAQRDTILSREPVQSDVISPIVGIRDILLERFDAFRRLPFTITDE